MSLNVFFLCSIFPILLMTTCEEPCLPASSRNLVAVTGVELDSVYNEITILPANLHDTFPSEYIVTRQSRIFLPLDISYDSTIYIFKNNNRQDTIAFRYMRTLVEDRECGFQIDADSVTVKTTFSYDSLGKHWFDKWELFLEF